MSPEMEAMPQQCLAFRGTLLHTPGEPGSVQVLTEHLVVMNNTGVIVHLAPVSDTDAAVLQAHGVDPAAVRVLGPLQFLLPGFIDTHAHAPQYQYCGVGTDLPLIGDAGWLSTYAFPTEASFADEAHARRVYSKCVGRLLRLGTTTANYFTTIHTGACKVLADVLMQAGQRAVLGKVCMDQHSPDFYTDASAEESLAGALEVMQYIKSLNCSRLLPAVIPRFIPTCSQQLLEGLGQMAAQHGLHIHSHISESLDQVQFTQQLHLSSSSSGSGGSSSDAQVYDAAGLLTAKSIFAHGTQLTEQDMLLMAERGSAVAHCPLSNFYFGDGLFDVSKALSMGLKVSLGTDVAGGYSPSMLQAQRMAVVNSHALKAAALMYGTWRALEQQRKTDEQQQQQQQQQSKRQRLDEQQQQQQQQPSDSGPQQLQPAEGATAGAKRAASTHNLNPAVAAAAAAHMLTWEDALWLATAGGAAALGLRESIGHFAVGMHFDALLIDTGVAGGPFDALAGQQPLLLLEQFFFEQWG
uniref:Amidohydrolase-related domain-containing protein n=1 Tax=Tetradesmus obliquus TaxID=3088 RepID=A0A383W514_TETOB|eukprot:jgi/Sobl393_1/14813/SZX71756.1